MSGGDFGSDEVTHGLQEFAVGYAVMSTDEKNNYSEVELDQFKKNLIDSYYEISRTFREAEERVYLIVQRFAEEGSAKRILADFDR